MVNYLQLCVRARERKYDQRENEEDGNDEGEDEE